MNPLLEKTLSWVRAGKHWKYALAAVLALAGYVWLKEHDARLRAEASVESSQKAAQATIEKLNSSAKSALETAAASQAQVAALGKHQAALIAAQQDLQQQLAGALQAQRSRDEGIAAMTPERLLAAVKEQMASAAPAPGGGVTISDQDTRKVESCFLDLAGCREQSGIKDAEIANFGQQLTVSKQIQEAMQESYGAMRTVSGSKDAIIATQSKQFEAELKAARGGPAERFWNRIKFPLGIGIGLVAGYEARK